MDKDKVTSVVEGLYYNKQICKEEIIKDNKCVKCYNINDAISLIQELVEERDLYLTQFRVQCVDFVAMEKENTELKQRVEKLEGGQDE